MIKPFDPHYRVKQGWVCGGAWTYYSDVKDPGYMLLTVWNEILDENADAHPVERWIRISQKEFQEIEKFRAENPTRDSFSIIRTNGGALIIGIEI